MSRAAIAAAMAREDVAGGERLVAFALASFAGRDGRAWPGTPAAAARAGLSRSRYLEARELLVRRGLCAIEEAASRRGRASTVALLFAGVGPWWEGEINAELFDAVLARSRARGPARLVLAALAALADGDGVVRGVCSEELRAAAGVADRTYRRARRALLESGELVVLSGAGGRGHTNVWQVQVPSADGAESRVRAHGVAPPAGARPLVASSPRAPREAATGVANGARSEPLTASGGDPVDVPGEGENCPVVTGVYVGKGGQDQTVPAPKGPIVTRVYMGKRDQDRTVIDETPAETPAQTPAENARAGREPQNPRTRNPPQPPKGGSDSGSLIVEQDYFTDRGRRRRRAVCIDLDTIRAGIREPTPADGGDWDQIRKLLEAATGESAFAIWLGPVRLVGVDEAGRLVLAAALGTERWLAGRYGAVLGGCAAQAGRQLRLASPVEIRALGESGIEQTSLEVAG